MMIPVGDLTARGIAAVRTRLRETLRGIVNGKVHGFMVKEHEALVLLLWLDEADANANLLRCEGQRSLSYGDEAGQEASE